MIGPPLRPKPRGSLALAQLWVPETELARCAGHGVAVLLKICVQSIDGQADAANQRITDALDTTDAETGSGHEGDEDSAQAACNARSAARRRAGRSADRSSGRSAHRSRPRRPCPSVDSVPSGPGTHGRIADGGSPKSRLETHKRWSAAGTSAGASVL
jgi:hypothetical protein